MRGLLCLVVYICCTFQLGEAIYCDQTFRESEDGTIAQNSTYDFEAPTFKEIRPYKVHLARNGPYLASKNFIVPNVSVLLNITRPSTLLCIYKIIANEGERITLSFSRFRLRGDESECNKEYVDMFANLKSGDDLPAAMLREQPDARFCTSVVPRQIVSLHNIILFAFYTTLGLPPDGKPIFTGSFEFNRPKIFDQIGPAESGTLCTHTIQGSQKREGEFQSITYPGSYVKNLKCSYKFLGEPGQRVRLEFLDLDLYSGGPHCPFDSIKVFDGTDEMADPLIQTICGSHRSLVIFSTRENIMITFTTLKREMEVQNRGFSAYFEFSDKFSNPNFNHGNNSRHIRGSECDQRIVSAKGSKGIIVSPDTKNHPNAICRYIFEGLQTSLDNEKVVIKFTEFDLKTQRIIGQDSAGSSGTSTSTTTMSTTTSTSTAANQLLLIDPIQPASSTNASLASVGGQQNATNSPSDQVCPDNYVRLYTGEQKPDQKQDPNDYDFVFCGADIPPPIESDTASLLIEYNSGSVGGQFRAEYKFIVDFRIPGQQLGSSCNYIYKSDILKLGTFNSPRHPSWYINDINCSYTLLTKSDETLLLQFTSFKMAHEFGEKDVGQNEHCRGQDSVEISELILDSSEQRILDQVKIGTYCGTTAPGPILSYRPVRVVLRTNAEQAHYGFGAIYTFHQISELRTNDFVANCGGQINSRQLMQRSGAFSSPPTYRSNTYEKRNHFCTWNITVHSGHRVQLDFNTFAVEGNPAARGCAAATVRLEFNRNKEPIELCGTIDTKQESARRFVSDSEWMIVTFISTKRASGSDGFTATWTEIKKS